MNTRQFRYPAQAAFAGLLALVAHTSCMADEHEATKTDESKWAAGLFAMHNSKPYRQFDNKTEAVPVLSYENRWVKLFGPRLDVKLGSTGSVSYALTANYADDGYKSGDSPYLTNMADRKSSIWLGGRVTWANELANLSLGWQGDASSHSKGQRVTFGMERRFTVGDLGISPRFTATWRDRKDITYYYGVAANEAQADRPAYEGNSTVNTEVGMRLDYRFARRHTAMFDVVATMLGSSIKNSPLVDQSSTTGVRLGYLYQF